LDLVQGWIDNRESGIQIDLGVYPYPDYEPMEFWGSQHRLALALVGDRVGDDRAVPS
jgi:dTDP-6-deoxy-L-talose 4-dehydrogenase (NAD+)